MLHKWHGGKDSNPRRAFAYSFGDCPLRPLEHLRIKNRVNLRATDWRNLGLDNYEDCITTLVLPPVALHLMSSHETQLLSLSCGVGSLLHDNLKSTSIITYLSSYSEACTRQIILKTCFW